MIVFDVLSELESYVPAVPDLKHVITIMDRSLPYEKGTGVYACPESEKVSYRVDSYMTSTKGVELTVEKGTEAVVIALDGEEMVSSAAGDEVFILTEGRFLLLSEGTYKRGTAVNLPSSVKDVVFTLTT